MSGLPLLVLDDAERCAHAAADEVLAVAARATAARPAAIAISGGRTPLRMFELLAARGEVRWEHVHLFWADERCVPPTDARSNYAGAVAAWFSRGAVPATNVHRVHGELGPAAAAAEYEREVRAWFTARGDDAPRFDLVLLGMGADGHTASLFPGDAALDARGAWAVPATAPVEPRDRVTLTFESIAAAARVVFVVTGADKRTALASVRGGTSELPAARVAASLWIADRAAAG